MNDFMKQYGINDNFETIIKCAHKQYVDHNVSVMRNDGNGLYELIIDGCIITISPSVKWNDLKKHIDKRLSNKETICSICECEIKRKIACTECYNIWCLECYINLFRSGQGIIKCPYCRYEYGIKMSKQMVELGILEIRMK